MYATDSPVEILRLEHSKEIAGLTNGFDWIIDAIEKAYKVIYID